MENSIPEIPNNLPAARKQYNKLLEYERRLDKLFRMLDRCLKEGKRGDVTDEQLADQMKRADNTRRNMSAEKKALKEKFKELQAQQDTAPRGERNEKNVDFKKNPLKLIPKQSPAQKIPTKTTSFPEISFLKVKLVQISPMVLPEVLRLENVSLLETQELQPFKPTVKRVLSCGIPECIQTTSRGNEGKYSLHVSSETGAPLVSLNLSLSTASGLDLPCAFTTTRKRMMLPSTASKIQQLRALEKLMPLEQGPGTLLVVLQPSAARCRSLSINVLTLPSSLKPSQFPAFLPEDASNCWLISMPLNSYLVSALLSLQQLMRRELRPIMESSQLPLVSVPSQSSSSLRFSAVFSTLLPEDASIRLLITDLLQPSSPVCTQPSEMLLPAMKSPQIMHCSLHKLPFVSAQPEPSPPPVVLEPLPLAEILPPVVLEPLPLAEILPPGDQPLCGADEDSLAILNHSEVEILPCSQHIQIATDTSHSKEVEIADVDKLLKTSDTQDTSSIKSGCSETESNMSGSKKRKERSICRRILALFTCCFRKQRQRK